MRERWIYVGRQVLLVVIVAVLCCLFFALGLMLGYGLIGDGDNAFAILSLSKWQTIIGQFTGK